MLNMLSRSAVLCLLMVVFFSLEWTALRASVRDAICMLLTWLGHANVGTPPGEIALTLGRHRYGITAFCTCIDLFFLVAALSLRPGLGIRRNVSRTVLLAVLVGSVNLLRLSVAIHLHTQGTSWAWAHDIPYALLYLTSFVIATVLALRSDWIEGPSQEWPLVSMQRERS